MRNDQGRGLALACGFADQSHLTRVFTHATGVTPKQFSSKVKLQVARDLVNDPQRSVEAIASSCGFEDARQLRRVWKQSFGVSIADFRAAQFRAAEGRSL